MNEGELRRKIWINSISNYLRLALRVVLGLLMFRMLYPKPDLTGQYHGLNREEFSFWALLWSVLGYGMLMDFGLGLAAQKQVAELSFHQRWAELSRVLSTIFYFYLVGALLVIGFAFLSSHWLIGIIRVDAAYQEPFRQILVMFLSFVALSLPFGISIEILFGQQRIALANNLASVASVINFVLVMLALRYHWGLMVIMIIAMLCALVPSLIGGWLGLKAMPAVRLSPRLCSWKTFRSTLRFSVFAYVGTLTVLIMSQTDRVVLSVLLSLTAVAIYQTGAKVAETFGSFTAQLPITVSPAAAHLNAKGDREGLRRLLTDGTRFNVMLATPLFVLCSCFMEGLLSLLTKGHVAGGETFWVAQVLLFWSYSSVITHSISKQIFMMCGHERRLTCLSVAEAVANLILSIALVWYFKNVISVALGSLIPSLIVGWGYLWPWAAKDAGVNGWQLAARVLFRNGRACLPALAVGLTCRVVPALDFRYNTALFFFEGGLTGLVAAAGLWQWALTADERGKISAKLGKVTTRFARRKPA